MKRLTTLLAIAIISSNIASSKNIVLADPAILCEGDTYYLSGTYSSDGFLLYTSTDLVHWTQSQNLALTKGQSFGTGSFWAPQFFKHNGKFYMAYAANEEIAIASSDKPEGPYTQNTIAQIPSSTKQIDPFVFFDTDGKKYLYHVRLTNGNRIFVAEINDDFQSIKEETLKECFGASDGTWEDSQNSTWNVSEGPTVIKDDGIYYLLYSCNDYRNMDYGVTYAYSTKPTGPWKKCPYPFISRHNTGISGSGHGDIFFDKNGSMWYVFHVWNSNTVVQNRRTAIVPLSMTDDPDNKFVIDESRMLLLTDNASASASLPQGNKISVDGFMYQITGENTVSLSFSGPTGNNYSGHITIPSTISVQGKTYNVTRIGHNAFYNCTSLKSVTIPSSIIAIDDFAFEGASIENITIGEGVRVIGNFAFRNASNLRSVVLPTSLLSMGESVFEGCSNLLDVICLGKSPSSIPESTFSSNTTSKGKLWVPDGSSASYAAAQGWKAFAHISGIDNGTLAHDFEVDGIYYSITSEPNLTVGVSAYSNNYASYRGPVINIPETVSHNGKTYSVTSIQTSAFQDSRLIETVNLPSSLTSIESKAFRNCFNITDFVIPDNVSTIKASAFSLCQSLKSIEIGSGVKTIQLTAFGNCLALESVKVKATTPPTLASSSFAATTYSNATLYVPAGARNSYLAANYWKKFLAIEEFTTNIGDININDETPIGIIRNGNNITLTNADGCNIKVFSLDGRLITSIDYYCSQSINLQPGLFIIKTDTQSIKVII